MNRPDPWQRLVAAARRAPDSEPTPLPPGFATRVAAQGLAVRREPADLLGLFGLRALGVAMAVVVAFAVVSHPLAKRTDNASPELDDPVGELVAQL